MYLSSQKKINGMSKLFFYSWIMLIGWVFPAFADVQAELINRAEIALNKMKTMQADFIQIASDGSVGEGKIYFRRPFQLRIDYLQPASLSFVTSKIWIHVDDKIEKQVTSYPVSQSPFYTLLQEEIILTGEEIVTTAELKDGIAVISLSQQTGEAAGQLDLEFDAQNWHLRRWVITDALGVRTQVTLQNQLFDLKIQNRLFGVPSYPVQEQ